MRVKMARRSIDSALRGQPGMLTDPALLQRKQQLIEDARLTLQAIRNLAEALFPGDVLDRLDGKDGHHSRSRLRFPRIRFT